MLKYNFLIIIKENCVPRMKDNTFLYFALYVTAKAICANPDNSTSQVRVRLRL